MKANTYLRFTSGVMLSLYALSSSAVGNTDSTSFAVKLDITATCSISASPATDVDFGSHASNAGVLTATGQLIVNCTNGTDYQIGLNNGNNYLGDVRNMEGQDSTNSGELVPYSLYSDAAMSNSWGDTLGTDTYGGTGTGENENIPVYAKLTSTNFKAGNYKDTVTAVVTY